MHNRYNRVRTTENVLKSLNLSHPPNYCQALMWKGNVLICFVNRHWEYGSFNTIAANKKFTLTVNRLGHKCVSFDVKNHVHNVSFVKKMGKLFLEMIEDVSILGVVSGNMMAGGRGSQIGGPCRHTHVKFYQAQLPDGLSLLQNLQLCACYLKVHFFISCVKILRFYKKIFLIRPLLGEIRFFRLV